MYTLIMNFATYCTFLEGLILANDVDNSRCYLLVRQALKRMPTSNCIVINEDAAFLPNFSVDKVSLYLCKYLLGYMV